MARTKIIATLGPATATKESISELIKASADIFRLNMSHGDYDKTKEIYKEAREAASDAGLYIPIFLDLRGPKLRIGKVEGDEIQLEDNAEITITTEKLTGNCNIISTDYVSLTTDLRRGNIILLDDGQIVLEVLTVSQNDVKCRIKVGGVLKSNKGMALPGLPVRLPALTDKDIGDVKFGVDLGVDGFMLSFVQNKEDIYELHGVMRANGATLPVIAKIESSTGMKNLCEIVEVADALLVARGDLGVDLPIWELPPTQKKIIETGHRHRKPVIVATEMLESMVHKSRPTRAEVSDVANAVFGGADIMMLSAETAVGKYPSRAVRTMDMIAIEAEKTAKTKSVKVNKESKMLLSESVSYAAVELASTLKAKAIILYTGSGFTARITSYFMPKIPIYAFTGCEHTARICNMMRGVYPFIFGDEPDIFDNFVEDATNQLIDKGLLEEGDTVVATNVIGAQSTHRRSNAIRVFQC